MTPRKENREDGYSHKSPLDRTLDYNATQQEECKDECTHIDGTIGHGLIAKILRELLQVGIFLRANLACFAHLLSLACLAQRHELVVAMLGLDGGATLHIGDEQRECLALAIAPLGDVFLVETAISSTRLRLAVGSRELAVTATHGLL